MMCQLTYLRQIVAFKEFAENLIHAVERRTQIAF